MKKLFLRAEFGPLWEPWEEDEIGRNNILLLLSPYTKLPFLQPKKPENSIKTWLSRQSPE